MMSLNTITIRVVYHSIVSYGLASIWFLDGTYIACLHLHQLTTVISQPILNSLPYECY